MKKLLTIAVAAAGIAGFAASASAECFDGHKTSMTTAENATPVPETKPVPTTATAETTVQTAQAPQDTATE